MSILRADSIKNSSGDGAPDFPNGITVTGIVTATVLDQNTTGILSATSIKVGTAVTITASGIDATGVVTATSFVGDGSSLTGIDATTIKDSGGTIRAQANTSGVNVSGVLTATSFYGDGSNLTGVGAEVTGGVVNTYPQGGYNYESRTFYNPGFFTITSPLNMEFCLIGGGGGGGNHSTTNGNGGGGAGGVVIGRGLTFAACTYEIVVGRGGRGRGGYSASGYKGEDSFIRPASPTASINSLTGIAYTAFGGGGGCATDQAPSGSTATGNQGGSGGGGAAPTSITTNITVQDTYDAPTAPMPISTYNNAPFRNSGTVNGYGNPGGTGVFQWGGGGGGGASSPGGGTPHGDGGLGFELTWTDGTTEYLAGGGGGGGNSSEPAGHGSYGGGRGTGTTPLQPNQQYINGQHGAPTYGMKNVNAKEYSGAGGGAGSYWAVGSAGQPGLSGNGGHGRVVLRREI